MADTPTRRILTINTGSSSLKAALYRMNGGEHLDLSAQADRIGRQGSHLRVTDGQGKQLLDRPGDLPDHGAAIAALLTWLRERGQTSLDAVGHRVVHGGSTFSAPVIVTAEVVAGLRQLVAIDPDHLPQAIAGIEATQKAFPGIPEVACFDTAFHRHMPRVAQLYPLPRRFTEEGIVRYGFHGLSYEYITQELRRLDSHAARGRVIVAHLGNGASMVAVRDSRSVDTTMGFTPTGGLMMGTRSGDLDPGVLLYLLQTQGMDAAAVSTLVNRESGLIGVSGISTDMHDLLERREDDLPAAEAVELFCYQAKKFLGALSTTLGGLDTLIFTGGIGEHAAPIREGICAGMEFIGIHLDPGRNAGHAPIISPETSPVTVRVISTNEDLMIARHTVRVIEHGGHSHVSV